MRDTEPGKQGKSGELGCRHHRDQDQEHIRRKVREDHRSDEANARCEARRQEGRDPREGIRAEKDAAQCRSIDPKPEVEPVSSQALDDEASAERVKRKEGAPARNDSFRSSDPKPPYGPRSIVSVVGRRGSVSCGPCP